MVPVRARGCRRVVDQRGQDAVEVERDQARRAGEPARALVSSADSVAISELPRPSPLVQLRALRSAVACSSSARLLLVVRCGRSGATARARGSGSPSVDVVVQHAAAQRPHPPRLLLVGRLHGLHDRVLEALDVVRVADERLVQLVGGAGELAEHQRAAVVVAAGDVLLGHQVHAVAQRGDEHDVGGLEHRRHLLARVGVVQVLHGRARRAAVLAVDPADPPSISSSSWR